MKKLEIELSDLLRAGHIKRWHIISTQQPQTLAEHNYNVATIALALYNEIVGGDLTDNPREIALLLAAALFHDATETRMGDIPTPGKWLIRHFGGDGIFDQIDNYLMEAIPLVRPLSSVAGTPVYDFIKMADYIDAAAWIHENKVGARAGEVAAKCWVNMELYVEELTASSGVDWREAVNKVLTAMLAPTLRSRLS